MPSQGTLKLFLIRGLLNSYEWFNNNRYTRKDTFVVSNYYPADVPANVEGYVQFLRGSNGARTIVLYWEYTGSNVWRRRVFNNEWKGEWVKII